MLRSISANRSQYPAYLSQYSAGSASGNEPSLNQQPDVHLDPLASEQRRQHIQQLIEHSMDNELFQKDGRRSASHEAQAAIVRGLQKQVSAYTITQAQRELLGFPSTQSLGYG